MSAYLNRMDVFMEQVTYDDLHQVQQYGSTYINQGILYRTTDILKHVEQVMSAYNRLHA